MTRVRPAQVWERRQDPGSTPVIVRECTKEKVTYQSMRPGMAVNDVITIQKVTFKRIYRKRKANRG